MNDQVGYITTARNITEHKKYENSLYYPSLLLKYRSHNLIYMPGNYYIRAAFFKLFGYSIFTAFLPNLLAFIGSAIILFLIADHLFKRKSAAYMSTLLFIFFPPFVLYSFSAMLENLFIFACLLSFYAFIRLPQRSRFILGSVVLIPPFFIRESASIMVIGFAAMVLLENKHKGFQKALILTIIAIIILVLIFMLPSVSNRPPQFHARLIDKNVISYADAYALENVYFTYTDTVKLIWYHFLKNLKIFQAYLSLRPLPTGFAYFIFILFLSLVCSVLLLLNKSINRPFAAFAVTTSLTACISILLLFYFRTYMGLRHLLFLVPFLICVIVNAIVMSKLFKKRTLAIISVSLIFLINIYFFGNSLFQFHKDFLNADAYDRQSVDFLDSVGVSNAKFFVAPFSISLDYVNRHYPIKWSFIPANEKTLRLLTDKFFVDILIIPYGHVLIHDRNSDTYKTSLLENEFVLTGTSLFLNQTYLIFKPITTKVDKLSLTQNF